MLGGAGGGGAADAAAVAASKASAEKFIRARGGVTDVCCVGCRCVQSGAEGGEVTLLGKWPSVRFVTFQTVGARVSSQFL